MSVYFDIDDILMEEQRVPCTFRYNAEGLGFLSAGTVTRRKTNEDDVEEDLDSSDEDDGSDAEKDMLGAGSTIELPFWLAKPLKDKKIVAVDFPHFFNARARKKFNANANAWSVNIKEKNYYYYGFGIKLAKLLNDKTLPSMMRTILALRFNRIIDQAQNCIHEDTSIFRRQLTHCELKLFQAGFKSAMAGHKWRARATSKLKGATVIKSVTAAEPTATPTEAAAST